MGAPQETEPGEEEPLSPLSPLKEDDGAAEGGILEGIQKHSESKGIATIWNDGPGAGNSTAPSKLRPPALLTPSSSSRPLLAMTTSPDQQAALADTYDRLSSRRPSNASAMSSASASPDPNLMNRSEVNRSGSKLSENESQWSATIATASTTTGMMEASGYRRERFSAKRNVSKTSLELTSPDAQRKAVQVGVHDLKLVGEGDYAASTLTGIKEVVDEELQRLSSQVTSQAYQNDLRGSMTEKKLLEQRSGSKANPGATNATPTPTPTVYGTEPDGLSEREESFVREQSFFSMGAFPEPGTAEQELAADLKRYIGWVSPIKWLMTLAMAVVIALQAGGIIHGTYRIVEQKMLMLSTLCESGASGQLTAYLLLLVYASPACFVSSWLVTYVAPHSGGSGIPEIKAFLNGIAMPQAFTFATWASRSTGLMLVTSSGMFAGTEGPFAHLGGIVAKFFADGPECKGVDLRWPTVLIGHRNRCEFISQGCAMGVAAAFGAPIGGILFSLEEASTFWSKALTWRAFLGTVVAAMLAKLAKSGFTTFEVEGFIAFPDKEASFQLWELTTFGPLALVMGLLGALFCGLVRRLLKARRKYFKLGNPTRASRVNRLIEVQVIVFITMTICFWPAALMGCREVEANMQDLNPRRLMSSKDNGPPDLTGGICPIVNGYQTYSDLGYILLSPKELAIRTLFSREYASGAYMSTTSLLVAWAIVYFMTILTFGSAMPVGLFIPNILSGACLGRAVGQMLADMDFDVHPGVYALMGSAGALGGFSRMTISLAVIFLEITNSMNLLIPLMLVIMVSKVVADQFNPSVYDIVLEVNPSIHLLEDNLSEDQLVMLQGLKVHDVCTAEIVVLRICETIGEIMKLLMRTTFGGFPVVDDDGVVAGIITRTQLVSILDSQKDVSEQDTYIPLLRYANTAPDITNWNTSVVNAFHHFRSSGLQHLCVVDQVHRVVGILTRTDFSRLCHLSHSKGLQGLQPARAAARSVASPVRDAVDDSLLHRSTPEVGSPVAAAARLLESGKLGPIAGARELEMGDGGADLIAQGGGRSSL